MSKAMTQAEIDEMMSNGLSTATKSSLSRSMVCRYCNERMSTDSKDCSLFFTASGCKQSSTGHMYVAKGYELKFGKRGFQQL